MPFDVHRIYAANGYGRQPERVPRWLHILRATVKAHQARRERRRYNRALIRRLIRARGGLQLEILNEINRRGVKLTADQIEQAELFRIIWDQR